MQAGAGDHHEREVGRQHDEVAVGNVHQPHDAVPEREPDREQRVQAAEQDSLDDGVDPLSHAGARPQIPKYAAEICRWDSSDAVPTRDTLPCMKQ